MDGQTLSPIAGVERFAASDWEPPTIGENTRTAAFAASVETLENLGESRGRAFGPFADVRIEAPREHRRDGGKAWQAV